MCDGNGSVNQIHYHSISIPGYTRYGTLLSDVQTCRSSNYRLSTLYLIHETLWEVLAVGDLSFSCRYCRCWRQALTDYDELRTPSVALAHLEGRYFMFDPYAPLSWLCDVLL